MVARPMGSWRGGGPVRLGARTGESHCRRLARFDHGSDTPSVCAAPYNMTSTKMEDCVGKKEKREREKITTGS